MDMSNLFAVLRINSVVKISGSDVATPSLNYIDPREKTGYFALYSYSKVGKKGFFLYKQVIGK